MAYEHYKIIKTKEVFFNEWEPEKLSMLTDSLKDYIYNKYLTKCQTLQRDNFTCQNKGRTENEGAVVFDPCKYCKNVHFFHELTIHHIKFKKNDGEDKVRNQITLCAGSHNSYHKANAVLAFLIDAPNIPPHIRGHTFKLEKPDKVDWKKIKSNMRTLRQEIKFKLGESIKQVPVGQRRWFTITAEQILLLLKWLYIPYNEMTEDDD